MVDKPEIIETQRFEDFRGWLSVSAEGFHVVQINQGFSKKAGTLRGLHFQEGEHAQAKLHVFDKDWAELPFAHREHIGCTVDYVAGRNRYMSYLISLGIYSFKGVKVGLDCANGSSWNIAKSVFDVLGADTYVINNKPNGLNINNNAGSTHIEGLQKFVVENGLDVGFAFDGDADRCLCVDEKGNAGADCVVCDPLSAHFGGCHGHGFSQPQQVQRL